MSATPVPAHLPRCRHGMAAALIVLLSPLQAEPVDTNEQPHKPPVTATTVDQLKRDYLSCSRAAVSGRMNPGAIMQCSVIYEQLKNVAFDGDFAKLHAWSKRHPLAR